MQETDFLKSYQNSAAVRGKGNCPMVVPKCVLQSRVLQDSTRYYAGGAPWFRK